MFRNRAQHIQWLTESVLSGLAGGVKDVVDTAKYATGVGTSPGAPTLRSDLKMNRGFSSPSSSDSTPTLKQYQNSNPPAPTMQPRPSSTTSDSPFE